MLNEVAEHRQTIVSQVYKKGCDIQCPAILKELKNELFNLNGSALSTSTLTKIKDNIVQFKNFMQKLDDMSICGTGAQSENSHRIPFQGLEQIPQSSIQAENLVSFKDVLENYKYMVNTQNKLIKKAINQNKNRLKKQIKNNAANPILANNNIENVRDYINRLKDQEAKDEKNSQQAQKLLMVVQDRIQKEKANYEVSLG